MIDFGYYLLKVSMGSGILYCYYLLCLRNRKFHNWNRFYLLGTIVISLLLPLLKIHVSQARETYRGTVVQLLKVASAGDQFVHETIKQPANNFPVEQAVVLVYAMICVLMLGLMVKALLYIHKLIRINSVQLFEHFCFVSTNARGTPFSFFKYVFWNKQVEPASEIGQQMLRHELVHVRERHSHDKIFINLVLLIFWSNPFFWLIRREISMIHEFIADQKSVGRGNMDAFSSMILQAVFPQHRLGITNYFFHSPLKRRLVMLSKNSNPRASYVSRLLVLPVLAILIAAFSFKLKKNELQSSSMRTFEEPFTLLIDAGHGGDDYGATTTDGILEKDLTLKISKKIRHLNTNPNLRVLLTREQDVNQNLVSKTDSAASKKPGAFISIHIDAASPIKTVDGYKNNDASGISIYLSARNTQLEASNILLGSLLSVELKKSYGINAELKKREGSGIWILDAPSVNYPALLIEFGYMTNISDLTFIKDEKNQEKIARNILDAVQRFALSKDHILNNSKSSIMSNDGPKASADTTIEIIYKYSKENDTHNRKKVAGFLQIPEDEIQNIDFKGLSNGDKNAVTIVTLKDKTKKQIADDQAKKIGIKYPYVFKRIRGTEKSSLVPIRKGNKEIIYYQFAKNQKQDSKDFPRRQPSQPNILNQEPQPVQTVNHGNPESQKNSINK